MGDLHPRQVQEWHHKLNEPLTPFDVKPGSGKRVWWLCSICGRSWQAPIQNRTKNNIIGCKQCSYLRAAATLRANVCKSGRSLSEMHPKIASEFHPTKNGGLRAEDIPAGDNRRFWWLCKVKGHEWEASANSRTNANSGCRQCSLPGTSETEIRLGHELEAAGCPIVHDFPPIPVIGRRPVKADIVIADYRVVVEFDSARYHMNPTAMRRDKRQTDALQRAGWIVIRVREQPLPRQTKNCVVVPIGAPIKVLAIRVLEQIRSLGFQPEHADRYQADTKQWAATIADKFIHEWRTRNLVDTYPDVAKDWDYERNGDSLPEYTKPNSLEPVSWICNKGHSYRSSPASRTYSGSGCPICARERMRTAVITPANGKSAGDLRSELLEIWHPTLNGRLTLFDFKPTSRRKTWWKCPICHEPWQAQISQVGPTCKPCSYKIRAYHRRLPEPGNSLADLRPDIACEWDGDRNDLTSHEVGPGSDITVWWKCKRCQHSWLGSVRSRTSRSSGCRNCK